MHKRIWLPGALALAMAVAPVAAGADGQLASMQLQLAAAAWQEMAPGVERLAVAEPVAGGFAAFRLAQDKIAARVLAPLKPSGSTAEEILAASKAFLVVNGGFFYARSNGALAPTGLLIADGAQLAGLKACRACTGVVYTDAKGLHIVRPARFSGKVKAGSALQVGPMLIDVGRVQNFKADGPQAPRTGLCLAGEAIIVAVTIRAMTLHDFAALLAAGRAEGGFDCQQAINFDGGSSSQLASHLAGAEDRLGFSEPVQNFLAFFPK